MLLDARPRVLDGSVVDPLAVVPAQLAPAHEEGRGIRMNGGMAADHTDRQDGREVHASSVFPGEGGGTVGHLDENLPPKLLALDV